MYSSNRPLVFRLNGVGRRHPPQPPPPPPQRPPPPPPRRRTTPPRRPPSETRFFNLSKVSNGTWYVIHLLAAHGKRDALLQLLQLFQTHFTCPKCSLDTAKYISEHPLPASDDCRLLFEWTCEFHNAVTIKVFHENDDADRIAKQRHQAADQIREIMAANPFPGSSGDDDGAVLSWANSLHSAVLAARTATLPRNASIIQPAGSVALFDELTSVAERDLVRFRDGGGKMIDDGDGACEGCGGSAVAEAAAVDDTTTGLTERFI